MLTIYISINVKNSMFWKWTVNEYRCRCEAWNWREGSINNLQKTHDDMRNLQNNTDMHGTAAGILKRLSVKPLFAFPWSPLCSVIQKLYNSTREPFSFSLASLTHSIFILFFSLLVCFRIQKLKERRKPKAKDNIYNYLLPNKENGCRQDKRILVSTKTLGK